MRKILDTTCIHHSHRGVQYALKNYIKELKFYKFIISISRKGNPFVSAHVDSFTKTLKLEKVDLWEHRSMEDVQKRISYFIEDVYNHKRLYYAIGFCPPNEYELMLKLTPSLLKTL